MRYEDEQLADGDEVLDVSPVENSTAVIDAEIESNDVPPIHVPEPFTIDNAERASWAVRKIVEARKYGERVRQWAEGEVRRAEQEEEWLLRRFGVELEMWARAELQRRGGRRRSVNLPGGTIGFRMQPSRLEVVDERQLIGWCREHLPAAVRTQVDAEGVMGLRLLKWQQQRAEHTRLRERVLRDVVSKHFGETGEVPAGGAVTDEVDRFYVK